MVAGLAGNAGAVFADEVKPAAEGETVSEGEIPADETGDAQPDESEVVLPGEEAETPAAEETEPVSVSENMDETVVPDEAAGPEETVSADMSEPEADGTKEISGDISEYLFQEGGFPNFEEAAGGNGQISQVYGDAYDGAVQKVVDALGNWDGSRRITADIHEFSISSNDAGHLLADVINDHAEFFFVDGAYTCMADSTDAVQTITVAVKDGCTIEDSDAFNRKVAQIIGNVQSDWTDLQKTMYIHDYIVTHCQYDLTYSKYTAEDVILGGSAVCEGYSLAFKHLMNKLGSSFKCDYVGSNRINHAWNYLTVSGKQYYVDCTWDDPIGGGENDHNYEYYCRHLNFLLSRDKIKNGYPSKYSSKNECAHDSTDWKNKDGKDIYNSVPGSSDLEDKPWIEMNSPMPLVGNLGAYYSGEINATLNTYDFRTSATNKLMDYTAKWYVWGESSWWEANYSSISSVGNYFTLATPTQIYLVNSNTGENKVFYTLNETEKSKGYIYGAMVEDGFLNYQLYTERDSNMKGSGKIDVSAYDSKGAGVVLDKYEIELGINETAQLSANVIPEDTENKEVVFSSFDPTIANVDGSGSIALIRGVSEGDTSIEVKPAAGGKSAFCRVMVRSKKTQYYTVTFVAGGNTVYSEEVKEGDTVKNVPEDPAGPTPFTGWYTEKGALWNSLTPVTGNMTLTAGFAPSSAQDAPGSGLDTALLPKSGDTLYLTKGQTYDLDSDHIWTSQDKSVLQILKKFRLKAKAVTEGTMITGVPVSDEGSEISFTVVVTAPLLQKNATVLVGQSMPLELDLGDKAEHYNVSWFSSNPGVASVADGQVFGGRKGSCKVTAYVNGKALTSTVKVVEKKAADPIGDEAVVVEPLSTITLKFADGFKVNKKTQWASSLPLTEIKDKDKKTVAYQNSVVRITPDGKLKAVGTGMIKVKAVTSEGEKTFTVNVPSPKARTYYMMPGKSMGLSLLGVNTKKVVWTSTQDTVARIRSGVIKTGGILGAASVSGNYNPYKNERGFDYVIKVYNEKPSFELAGNGQLTVGNSAGTVYNLDVKEGDVCRIKAKDGTCFEPVLFRSNKNGIAFVDESGTVYARKAGANGLPATAKLTARIAGKTYTIKVKVSE